MVVRTMYEVVTTAVKMKDGESDCFEVKVGVHQGLVLSPCCTSLSWKLCLVSCV
jgi:hypothetical protein